MTGRNWSALIFSGTALVFLSAAAQAQTPSKAQQDAIRSNCRSDFMRNCSGVTPGGREALECLAQNKAKVSGGCQAALNAIAAPAAAKPEPRPEPKPEPKPETRSEPAQPAAAPPAATAAPHSPEAPKAPPPAAARPAPKAAPKSATAPARAAPPPPAAAAVPPPPAEAAPGAPRPMRLSEAFVIRRYCFNDFKVLCKGIQLGQGRAVRCLADNREALSPGCRQALANAGN